MNDRKHFWRFWFPVIIYAGLIFWGSSQSDTLGIDLAAEGKDKIAHILEYSIFGALLMRALGGYPKDVSAKNLAMIVLLIGTFYGATDELHQYFVPGRTAGVLDLLCNSIGSFTGAVTFVVFGKNYKEK